MKKRNNQVYVERAYVENLNNAIPKALVRDFLAASLTPETRDVSARAFQADVYTLQARLSWRSKT